MLSSGIPFAMAAAYNDRECGLGYTLVDPEGKFFCGFEQNDGSVVFAPYSQEPQSGADPVVTKFAAGEITYKTDQPLFLSPAEMEQKGLAAAAFGVQSLACQADDIPASIMNECKVASVLKDLTYKPEDLKRDLLGFTLTSQSGLASPKACNRADEVGYVSFRKEISSQVSQAKAALKKLFKPGGPS